MKYQEYFQKFGGSFRAKHCGKRGVSLPVESGLPREFVRLDPWEAEYIWSVAERASVCVLEIGRCKGGSTFLFSCATTAPIVSIDNAPRDDVLLRSLLCRHGIWDNVRIVVADSRVASAYPPSIGLLFIDGDHSYEGCKADLMAWHERVIPGGDIVFHDCYEGSYGVRKVVEEFADGHPEFEVVVPPSIPAAHWTLPNGSIAHIRKRS